MMVRTCKGPARAALRILAFKGIGADCDRENQLSGAAARIQKDRVNINGEF